MYQQINLGEGAPARPDTLSYDPRPDQLTWHKGAFLPSAYPEMGVTMTARSTEATVSSILVPPPELWCDFDLCKVEFRNIWAAPGVAHACLGCAWDGMV